MISAGVRRLLPLTMNACTSSNGGCFDDNGKDVLLVNRAVAITEGIEHSANRTLELLPAFAVFATTELLKCLEPELFINLSIKRHIACLSSHVQNEKVDESRSAKKPGCNPYLESALMYVKLLRDKF